MEKIIKKYETEEQKGDYITTDEEFESYQEAFKKLSTIKEYSISNYGSFKNETWRITVAQYKYNEDTEDYEIIDGTNDVIDELVFNQYGELENEVHYDEQ